MSWQVAGLPVTSRSWSSVPAAVPTASWKSVFSPLNDWFPIFGARSDGLLPAKSEVSFRHSVGFLAVWANSRFQSAGVGQHSRKRTRRVASQPFNMQSIRFWVGDNLAYQGPSFSPLGWWILGLLMLTASPTESRDRS